MKKQKLISNLYERQSTDNWQDFLGCSDFEDRRNIFFKFIKEFEEQKVEWALGCSSNLFLEESSTTSTISTLLSINPLLQE